MRVLAKEENAAVRKFLDNQKKEYDEYISQQMQSNSAKKKMLARHHNEWQAYKERNKIIQIFKFVYTELETPIEGSIHEIN